MRVNAAPQGALRAASFSASLVMTTKKYARPAAARPLCPVRDSTFILGAINALFCLRYDSYQFPYIPIYLFG